MPPRSARPKPANRPPRAWAPLLFGAGLFALGLIAGIAIMTNARRQATPEHAAREVIAALRQSNYLAFYERLGPETQSLERWVPVPERPGIVSDAVMASARAYLGLTDDAQPRFATREALPRRVVLEVFGTKRFIEVLPTRPRMIMVFEEGAWRWELLASFDHEAREAAGEAGDALEQLWKLLGALPLEDIRKSLGFDRAPPPASDAEAEGPGAPVPQSPATTDDDGEPRPSDTQ